jgi:tetratricopeptide (TPR) repeat protein
MQINSDELFSYASELTSQRMYDDALEYYKTILKQNADSQLKAKVYNNMAIIYEIKGENLLARKYYREAINLSNNEEIYRNYQLFLDTL